LRREVAVPIPKIRKKINVFLIRVLRSAHICLHVVDFGVQHHKERTWGAGISPICPVVQWSCSPLVQYFNDLVVL